MVTNRIEGRRSLRRQGSNPRSGSTIFRSKPALKFPPKPSLGGC